MQVIRACLPFVLLAVAGCQDIIGPASAYDPEPKVAAVAVPAVADSLWQTLVDCAGIQSVVRLHELRWHRVEADQFTCGPHRSRAVGCWDAPVDIYLAYWVFDEPWWHAARHEMLHAWLGLGQPPGHTHPAWSACAETVPEPHG